MHPCAATIMIKCEPVITFKQAALPVILISEAPFPTPARCVIALAFWSALRSRAAHQANKLETRLCLKTQPFRFPCKEHGLAKLLWISSCF